SAPRRQTFLIRTLVAAVAAAVASAALDARAQTAPQTEPQTAPSAGPDAGGHAAAPTGDAPCDTDKAAPAVKLTPAEMQRRNDADRNAPVHISAEQLTGRPDREVHLRNDVQLQRGGMTVTADRADYDIVKDEVEAMGNICMRRYGDRYTGDALQLNLDSGVGFLTSPTYRLEVNNGRGRADRVEFESQEVATVVNGTYSTCEGPDPDWYLKSSRLRVDTGSDTGESKGTVVYFKGVPILGAPSMSFPLTDERKSGVLPPTIGTTSRGGFEVSVPYYFNIAPNRDLTLYPKIFSRRGLQLGANGRYLGDGYAGQTTVELLPNDRVTHTDRYAISSLHNQTLAPGLSLGWNYNRASDNDYPTDFASSLTTATQRLLLRDLNLTYGSTFWTATARASSYQILQDPAAPIAQPYSRLPQLTLTGGRQDVNGFDWGVSSEFTRFYRNDAVVVNGDRAFVTPQLSYPIIRPGYFITPKISLDATTYRLENQTPGTPDTLNRVVPTASLDTGLVFERDARFFGRAMTQTLEPRLFYVRTPFRDQSQIPLFDTALADFNFAQLFSENRFVGHDRISDANDLTTAMTSRFIEKSGIERARLAIGQRFHFGGSQASVVPGVNESRSDLLLLGSGQVTDKLALEANIQYSETLHRMNRDNYSVRWRPGPAKVLNLEYRRDRLDLLNPLSPLDQGDKQIDVSGQWPIAQRWYGVSRVNYSLLDKRIAESLFGVEYKADCWIFRVVGQRVPTAAQQSSSAIFIQLELNGLSRLGSNPMQALRNNVPGYQSISPSANAFR
ncbi:MAG: LPS-assembly protein LptD, partial [Burkholderiaceae bacterium]